MTLKEALEKAGKRRARISYREYGAPQWWVAYLQSDEEKARCADVKVVKYKECETDYYGFDPVSGVMSKYKIPAVRIRLDSRQATAILSPNRLENHDNE